MSGWSIFRLLVEDIGVPDLEDFVDKIALALNSASSYVYYLILSFQRTLPTLPVVFARCVFNLRVFSDIWLSFFSADVVSPAYYRAAKLSFIRYSMAT